MVTENKLKEVTNSIITKLNECKIRTIMATGDNTLTAISVGKQCGILQEDQTIFYGDVKNGELVWRRSD
jgi:cation-transporting ATPase 13A2